MIVIGLGTGRSGTTSLARLLSAQRNSVCFHEMNPACVRFTDTPGPILGAVEQYQKILNGGDPSMITVDLSRTEGAESYETLRRMQSVRLIGDVAFYYLVYVRLIAESHPNVRFLCVRRDIDQTVKSWLKQTEIHRWRSRYFTDRLACLITRAPFHESRNHWMVHSGTKWKLDPVWDKCFPKFDANSKAEAIRKYCEAYYEEASRIRADLTNVFRFVEITQLSNPDYQSEVLAFLGIQPAEQVFADVLFNRSPIVKQPEMLRFLRQ